MSTDDTVATLLLNPTLCDGRGMCHDAAPDLIELDEWGYPLLPGHTLRADLTKGQLKAAEDATHACPVLALHIERRR
ncbi:MAG: ferredoxin [Actinobacteria bacterium]|nr:ferredoxin [Actinomycetota bacterium]